MKEISWGEFSSKAPLRAMLELTYRCNFSCRHCYVGPGRRRGRELGTRGWMRVMDGLREAGFLVLGFTGGEPFLRADLFELIAYARRSGFRLILNTNGYFIDEAAAGELSRWRLDKVDVTVPAVDYGIFDSVTGRPGSARRVFRGLDMLKRRGVAIGLKACLLKENAGEARALRDYAASMGAFLRLGNKELPRLGSAPRLRGALPCGAGRTQCAVTPRGELKPCLAVDGPRLPLRGRDFSSQWARLKRLKASAPDPGCLG
jgi:MoaA/NifB/PqqE/SkfB family radical SAM enzyme